MANELGKVILAGAAALFVMWLMVTPGALSFKAGPSGNYLANQDRYTHTVIAEGKTVGSSFFPIAKTEGAVKDEFNGQEKGLLLPFTNDLDWFGADGRGLIELTVKRAAGGELVMTINGQEIYRRATTTGRHYVNFDKDILTGEDVLEIKASRGAAFWSSADYDVKAEIKGEIPSVINATFLAPTKYKRARLIAAIGQTDGKLIVKVNGQTVYEGEPESMLNIDLQGLKQANRIEMTADTGAKHFIDWAEIRFE
ncbi:MAG: hypothetical protein QXD77_01830 [Candidatus Aenigmatarchaeota archaeon]